MPSNQHSWECPKCGDVLEGQGPASLRWARQNHEYWEHERPERGLPGARQALTPGNTYERPVFERVPLDEAFFDGARLSPFDRDLLHSFYILWTPPKGYLTAAR